MKRRKGFTLAELLVVIAVIAIIFIVLISKVDFATDKAKDAGVMVDFRSYQMGVQQTLRENSYGDTIDVVAFTEDLNKNLDDSLEFTLVGGEYQSVGLNPYKYHYVLDIESDSIKVFSITKQGDTELEIAQSVVYADEDIYSNGKVLILNLMEVNAEGDVNKFDNTTDLNEQWIGDGACNVSVTCSDGGTASAYMSGYRVEIKAEPYADYEFIKWVDSRNATVSTDAVTKVRNQSIIYKAVFEPIVYYGITAVLQDPDSGVIEKSVSGSNVTLNATANYGYLFNRWTDDAGNTVSTDQTIIVSNRHGDKNYIAVIDRVIFDVDVESTVGGSAEASVNGTNVTITATADSGYIFTHWTDEENTVISNDPVTVVLNTVKDKTYTAHFVRQYTLNFVAGTGGSVSKTSEIVTSGSNSSSVTATPSVEYVFEKWVNSAGDTVSTSTTIQINNVGSNETYTARFIRQITLSYTAGTGGTVSRTSQIVVAGQDAASVTATANAGYVFNKWVKSDGSTVSTSANLTITNVSANETYTAMFYGSYTVTFTAGSGGTLTGTVSQTVVHGNNCTSVTAVPNTEYLFSKWVDGTGATVSTSATLTISNVTASKNYTAQFTVKTYTWAKYNVEIEKTYTGNTTTNLSDTYTKSSGTLTLYSNKSVNTSTGTVSVSNSWMGVMFGSTGYNANMTSKYFSISGDCYAVTTVRKDGSGDVTSITGAKISASYTTEEVCGASVGTVTGVLNAYPTNGKHTDGYWYIKQ